MRCFIGIDIPSELEEKIVEIQKRFSRFDVKLTEKENFHINLIFLGEVDDKLASIKEIMDKIALNKFKISIRSAGVFPSPDVIKVIWLGIDADESLYKYHSELNNALKPLGYGDKRDFRTHLTLGRVKSGKDNEEIMKRINELKDVEIGEFQVNKIILHLLDLQQKTLKSLILSIIESIEFPFSSTTSFFNYYFLNICC